MDALISILSSFSLTDALDIAIVTFIIYKLLGFIKETRAQQLVRGIVVILVLFGLSNLLGLHMLNWLITNLLTVGLFALVVIFQPELRRGLEKMGRRNFVSYVYSNNDQAYIMNIVNEILDTLDEFSKTRTGALIVIEREIKLSDIVETGTEIDAKISSRLLGNIFYEGSPLHDGAVIIRGDRVCAAGCVLPLTENKNIGRNLGTRHRAAAGMSEVSDAFIIVVSEETGIISVAEHGTLRRFLDRKTIEKQLLDLYMPEQVTLKERLSNALNSLKGDSDGK